MKLVLDTDTSTLTCEENGESKILDLYSRESFQILSRYWVKVGWNQKYPYTFSWFGRPIIQIPEDMIRLQEVLFQLKPDVIVETGVAHGGSLVFSASICKLLGKGRVIGIDIEIRPHNRSAIEAHDLAPYISLIEQSSTDSDTIRQIREQIGPNETVLVILDSNHTRQHVLDELEAYGPLVTPGSYIVATDGVMTDLHDVPRGKPDWIWDNPREASLEFLKHHPEFVMEQPVWPFNESDLTDVVTHWPNAWLRKIVTK